jgi:hypothetical protein
MGFKSPRGTFNREALQLLQAIQKNDDGYWIKKASRVAA